MLTRKGIAGVKPLICVATACLFTATSVRAATVVWSAPSAITSNTDIQNPGSVVTALNLTDENVGGTSVVNVGGTNVTFDRVQPFDLGDDANFFTNPGGVGADFDDVLDSFDWAQSSAYVVPFSGLTPGGTYLLQLFAADNRNVNWKALVGVDGVTTVLESGNNSGAVGPNGQEFINGTVTLGALETSFDLDVTFAAGAQANLGLINALVLSEVTASVIPTPAALPAGLGLLGLAAIRRRRHN